jgi:hypothetical protein
MNINLVTTLNEVLKEIAKLYLYYSLTFDEIDDIWSRYQWSGAKVSTSDDASLYRPSTGPLEQSSEAKFRHGCRNA